MELRVRINRFAILKDLENKKYWNYLIQEGVLDYDDLDELKAKKKTTTRKARAELLLGCQNPYGFRHDMKFTNNL